MKKKVHFKVKNEQKFWKNLAVLGAVSAFLVTGIVFARFGYKVLSICSFAAATGIVLFHLPMTYALTMSFLSVTLALTSNFFAILNHLINGSTLQINN